MPGRSQNREHRPAPELISDLASRVRAGIIRLPKFQRDFVWSRRQVLDLLDSVSRNYPIGSLLLWKSPLNLASDRSIAGLEVDSPDESGETIYLLDGCQRLSTICGALYWEPGGDPQSFWNLVYDLEEERFVHRMDLDEPPEHQLPLRLLPDPSAYFERVWGMPEALRDRARAVFNRFSKYEVAVVTLEGTSLSEIGRIFERINTRATPLTTVEIVRAATWSHDYDLLDQIDRVRQVLAEKHYGKIDRMLLLRAISAAAGLGFATADIERLPEVSHDRLRSAVTATENAARHAVDFLTTEIGTPTAEALPYPNQLSVVIEIFRRVPRPDSAQVATIRSWFWRTALNGYFEGWNTSKMAADLEAVARFADGARGIDVDVGALSTRLWLAAQYRRDTARTKAYALMLAAAGPRDLRTGRLIDPGRALAMANDMQYHHLFPKAWLMRRGLPFADANVLANVVMLTAISNQWIADQPPSAYLKDEIDFSGEPEMVARLDGSLVSRPAFDAAMADDYEGFLAARAETLLAWATDLTKGVPIVSRPGTQEDPEVVHRSETVEVVDTDTDD